MITRPFPAPPRSCDGDVYPWRISDVENELSGHKLRYRAPNAEQKAHQEALQRLITALYDDFYLTSKGRGVLKRKARKTGDPVFLEMAEDSKREQKEGLALYKENLDNPLPCSFTSCDIFDPRHLNQEPALRFDFVVQDGSLVPYLQYIHEELGLKGALLFWKKLGDATRYTIMDREVKHPKISHVVDEELSLALTEWVKSYDESAESVAGTTKRAEIYSIIQDYVPARLALDSLSKRAQSASQTEQIGLEESLLSEKRETLIEKLEETTSIMTYLAGLDERERLAELEASEAHDLDFIRELEAYRSVH